jgi:hypothetical protein
VIIEEYCMEYVLVCLGPRHTLSCLQSRQLSGHTSLHLHFVLPTPVPCQAMTTGQPETGCTLKYSQIPSIYVLSWKNLMSFQE